MKKEYRPILIDPLTDKIDYPLCPECPGYLEHIGFRHSNLNKLPILRCRDCKRIFVEEQKP